MHSDFRLLPKPARVQTHATSLYELSDSQAKTGQFVVLTVGSATHMAKYLLATKVRE